MTNFTNGMNGESPHELERMTARIAEDEGIHDLIGSTVQKTVTQYHSILQKGLEQEVERILGEFKSATADMELVVTQRVKSRLQDIVRQEVQRIFDTALSSTNESIFGSLDRSGDQAQPDNVEPPEPAFIERPAETAAEDPRQLEPMAKVREDDKTAALSEGQPEREAAPSHEAIEHEPIQDSSDGEAVSEPLGQQGSDEVDPETETSDSPPAWSPFKVNLSPTTDELETSVEIEEANSEDQMFEGTVRLNVEANDCIGEVVHFVRELRQKPQLRLLRMVGNNKDGVDIWLGLREPLHLRRILPQIEGVSISNSVIEQESKDGEQVLSIKLEPRAELEEVSATVEA